MAVQKRVGQVERGRWDVLLGCGGLDFECYRVAGGVVEAEDLADFLGEGTCLDDQHVINSRCIRSHRAGRRTLEAQLRGMQLDGHDC